MAPKFRKGDVVSIQGTVRYDFDEGDEHISLEIPDAISGDVWVKPEAVTVVRQHIVLGDHVAFTVNEIGRRVGQVLAISNDHAWIDLGGGDYCTRLLSTIQRAEDGS